MTSPGETLSPSLTSHFARLPSSIVGESAGIVMLIAIDRAPSAVSYGFHRIDNLTDARQRQLLEVGRVRHRHVLAGNGDDRRVEIVEDLALDAVGNEVADRRLRETFLDDDEAVSLLHRCEHRVEVERTTGGQVDDLRIDAHGRESGVT